MVTVDKAGHRQEFQKQKDHHIITTLSMPTPGPNVSTTPITAMGCRQCLPLSVVQLKEKHCRKPRCRNEVVDTFRPCYFLWKLGKRAVLSVISMTVVLCSWMVFNEGNVRKEMDAKNVSSIPAGGFGYSSKVHIFWEGHKILRNLPLTFDYSKYSEK